MMYARLMKIFLKENFSLRRLLGTDLRKNKGKAILLGLVILYALGAFLFTFGYMFFDFGKLLAPLGAIDILLLYIFLFTMAVSLILVLFRANGYLFRYKDFEILQPLPIKTRTVLFAKATVMMIMNYAGLCIFIAPIAFSYFYFNGFAIVTFLLFVVAFLLIPLLPMIVFSFISLLIARITARFRKSNILTIILLFVVFMGIMALSLSINYGGDLNPLMSIRELVDQIKGVYLPMAWFMDAIHNHDLLSLLFLALVNVVPFYLFLIVVQKLTTKTNQMGLSVVTRKNTKAVKSQSRPLFETLVIKEFRKFINVPSYAVNAGFGPVFLFLAGVLGLIFKNKLPGLFGYIEASGIGINAQIVVLVFVAFCLSTVYTTAITLSLEGKNFWIIKSAPIKPSLIMNAKLVFNLFLGLPFAFFALILLSVGLSFPLLDFFVLVLFSAAFALLTSVIGSIINLHFPKFDFINDIEVVKQSIGAMIGVLSGFGIIVIDGVGVFFLQKLISWELALVIISVFDLVVFQILFLVLNRTSDKIFVKLAG